ncbi:MAG: DUF1848 domain-containing protein [Rikenellaceae bacterium]|nr:DUF1848 domain-containing protein [Rikenellaceae bacterium]
MILSVSRRTDIPAFYSDWFYHRVKAGFVDIRNPYFPRQISRIHLNPSVVDCIVFWTKNPGPMLNRLDEISHYPFYFHVTVNPFDRRLEPAVPRKAQVIEAIKRLSDRIGPSRVIWRYDPVLVSDTMQPGYLTESFEKIAQRLSGYTDTVMTGFLTLYRKTERNLRHLPVRELSETEKAAFARSIASIAHSYGIQPQSCSVRSDLASFGIEAGYCIDPKRVERIAGYPIRARKDRNQREVCRCIESIDIGQYDSCPHACLYCYANENLQRVTENRSLHDPHAPLLIGRAGETDLLHHRPAHSLRRPDLFGLANEKLPENGR